jgi:hypothetical protein
MTAPAPAKAADRLTELDGLGIQLEADGARLRFRPREAVTADLAARLKAHKAELLAILATRKTAVRLLEVTTTWCPAWRDLWEERGSIIEYEGNTPRDLAEDRAFHELLAAVMADKGIAYAPGSIMTAKLLGVG